MKGDYGFLAVTTKTDPITGEVQPLFGLPVQVAKATDDTDVRFDIVAPSGAPRKQVYIDTATDAQVADADCPRGVLVGDSFKPIPTEAIAQIAEATKIPAMIVTGHIPVALIPWHWSVGTYYLQSPVKGGSPKAYKILYEALLADGQAITTKQTARSKQYNAVVYADAEKGCLVLQRLRFAAQLREPDETVLAPQQAQVDQKQIDIARQVIGKLPDGNQALHEAIDEAIPLKQALIEQAINGDELAIPTPVAATAASDDLTALLEASLEEAVA